MQIYVCVKHVPDSAANIKIVDQKDIEQSIAFLLNPYDEHAVTCADQIKKEYPGSAEVIAVSLGPEQAEKTIRSAMAMGVDRGILITTEKKHDSMVTARALKAAIEQDGNAGIIFTGKEAIDTEGMQTMFRIGALFDFPVINNVVKIKINDTRAIVGSNTQGIGINFYDVSLPCVIGAGRDLNTPLYPTFPDIVKARKKQIKQIDFKDLKIDIPSSGTSIKQLEPLLQNRSPKEIKGNLKSIAGQIVRILKDEAKVI